MVSIIVNIFLNVTSSSQFMVNAHLVRRVGNGCRMKAEFTIVILLHKIAVKWLGCLP